MKNMKILLILATTWLYVIGVYAQEKNVAPNSFIPQGKGIYKKISGRVIITKAKFGLCEYPDEIYFADAKGRLKNKIEILPNSIGNPNKVNVSYSQKYLGIYRNYRAKKPDTEKSVLKEDFILIDSTGGVLWETKGDSLKHVFFNDNTDGVSFLDPFSGSIDEYTVYGKFLDKKSYSKWVEKYYLEEESPVKSKCVVSDDGKYIAITRIAATKKEAFYELTLLGADGSVIFQENIKKLDGWVGFISTGKKTVIVYESNFTSNLQSSEKIMKQYSGYDFSGNKKWSQSEDNISFDGHFSDAGNEYLFLNDKAKMDLGTGKITK